MPYLMSIVIHCVVLSDTIRQITSVSEYLFRSLLNNHWFDAYRPKDKTDARSGMHGLAGWEKHDVLRSGSHAGARVRMHMRRYDQLLAIYQQRSLVLKQQVRFIGIDDP